MYAAVVRHFDRPPRYEEFAEPVPSGPDEELVTVLAAGLHPRVRSQADGTHYTATDALPLIPGIDGVGRRADGSLVYFVLPDTTYGALAERTVIDRRRSVPLPDGADPALLAAAMNPGMSSWAALARRVDFAPGMRVLVLGATGSAGGLAVQIAKHLGAGEIVAAGRDAAKLAALPALGADRVVSLAGAPEAVSDALGAAAAEVDVVLDYLWGAPTAGLILPLLRARADRGRELTWIAIGSVAGPTITLPSAALRQANLHFVGSGQGAISAAGFLAVLPPLARALADGTLRCDLTVRPLAEVAALWDAPQGAGRLVLTPPQAE